MSRLADEYLETLVEAKAALRRDAANLERCTSRALNMLGYENSREAIFADLMEQLAVIETRIAATSNYRAWASKSEEQHAIYRARIDEIVNQSPAAEPF